MMSMLIGEKDLYNIPDICQFSPHTQLLVNFFFTQKRVNRDKINLQQKCVNCDKNQFYNNKA